MYRQSYWKPTSKFRNVRQTYEGFSYDSKFEAEYAAELDLRLKAHDIAGWERQFKIELRVGDKLIARYFCDFRITHNDGTYELVEIKGIETEVYRLKRKLLEACWLPNHQDHTYTVIKRQR